jgi:hypothetical protein
LLKTEAFNRKAREERAAKSAKEAAPGRRSSQIKKISINRAKISGINGLRAFDLAPIRLKYGKQTTYP